MSSLRGARAFTLTELLVVIAILAALLSLVLPGVTLARHLAKASHCRSNLQQISQAVYGYLGDHERLPTGWTLSATQYVSWDDLLSDYDGRNLPMSGNGGMNQVTYRLTTTGQDPANLKVFRLYVCPSEVTRYPGDPTNPPTLEQTRFLRTYAWNRGWDGSTGTGTDDRVRGIYAKATAGSDWSAPWSSIRKPAETILLAEMRYIWNRLGSDLGIVVDNPNSTGAASTPGGLISQVQLSGGLGNRGPLHRTRWNYLFGDGHVEALTPEQTLGAGVATTGPVDALSRWAR